MRIFQGVGAAMLMANSSAILTDVFPDNQRGMALGVNQAAAFSGTFIGLVLGGLLAPINWRLIFLVSVPIGLFATVFGYLKLHETSPRRPARIDWPGNITFAIGLILVMVGITYGIEPYGHHVMGWTNPMVLGSLFLGVALLIAFCVIETKVPEPMFRLQLFKIRAFTSGVLASFLAALSRGGLMFMLIIWLQGIWLPLHGYAFSVTPLWAGIAMLPLTLGFLIAGPTSGILSDRFGARPFATGGMLGTAVCLALLEFLPVDFPYWVFAIVLLLTGLTMAAFGSPNRAGVMNSLPAQHRGAGSGMNTTFQNSAQVLSIGIFFTLMIVGLTASLPGNLLHGLVAHGVPPAVADHVAHLSPVSTLFAAFLGYDPVQHLVGAHTPGPPDRGPAARADRAWVLPRSDQRPVPGRPPRRPRLRHRGQPAGRRRLVAAGRPLRLLRARAESGPRAESGDQGRASRGRGACSRWARPTTSRPAPSPRWRPDDHQERLHRSPLPWSSASARWPS